MIQKYGGMNETMVLYGVQELLLIKYYDNNKYSQ